MMRTARHHPAAKWRRASAAVALAAGLAAAPLSAAAQEPAATPAPDAALEEPLNDPTALPPDPAPPPPAGPLRILSWDVASSPYAIAMRKLKATPPAWRTSFGSERRTIEAPAAPQASSIDADVVLMQGITNPRALRRLFPARKWRLLFSRRALETLPKGSVFTTPVSSAEVEAVAVRFRHGLRITSGAQDVDDSPPPAPGGHLSDGATPSTQVAIAATPVALPRPLSPGVSVRVIDRGRSLWLASVSLKSCSPGAACDKRETWQRWRNARHAVNEGTVTGGDTATHKPQAPCSGQTVDASTPSAAQDLTAAGGLNRDVLGCVAELTLP